MSCNQLLTHPSTHVERERKKHTVSRLQAPQQPHQETAGALPQGHPGLCGTPTVYRGCPRKDTRGYTGAQTGKAVGGPTQPPRRPTNDKRPQDTDKRQDKRAFSHKYRHALGNLHGSGAGSRNRRSTKSRTRRQQNRSGDVPVPQGDRAEKRNQSTRRRSPRRRSTRRPSASRFRRISTPTELLMCLWQCSERVLRLSLCTEIFGERVGEGNPNPGWTSDTVNVHVDVS